METIVVTPELLIAFCTVSFAFGMLLTYFFLYQPYKCKIQNKLHNVSLDMELTASEIEEQTDILDSVDDRVGRVERHIETIKSIVGKMQDTDVSSVIRNFVFSEDFEIDCVFDTVTNKEHYCEPYVVDNPDLTLENTLVIALEGDDLEYTVAVSRKVFIEIQRMLIAKAEHQGMSLNEEHPRKFKADIKSKNIYSRLPKHLEDPASKQSDLAPVSVDTVRLNPAIAALMERNKTPQQETPNESPTGS